MINRKVVKPLSITKIKNYSGPVNYITHHEVLKDSASTPVRIVSNSSFPNDRTALNECLVKGPNTLNCLFTNLIRFHSYETGLVFDYTKAYNSIQTGTVECHLRRLWMRFSKDEPWQQYGFDRLKFGDRPAAALMSVAMERASETAAAVAQS